MPPIQLRMVQPQQGRHPLQVCILVPQNQCNLVLTADTTTSTVDGTITTGVESTSGRDFVTS